MSNELFTQFGNCELCDQPAKIRMEDTNDKIHHFSCIDHMSELWKRLGKPPE